MDIGPSSTFSHPVWLCVTSMKLPVACCSLGLGHNKLMEFQRLVWFVVWRVVSPHSKNVRLENHHPVRRMKPIKQQTTIISCRLTWSYTLSPFHAGFHPPSSCFRPPFSPLSHPLSQPTPACSEPPHHWLDWSWSSEISTTGCMGKLTNR